MRGKVLAGFGGTPGAASAGMPDAAPGEGPDGAAGAPPAAGTDTASPAPPSAPSLAAAPAASPAAPAPGLRPRKLAAHALRDAALEALSPTRCASCERPGALICSRCQAAIVAIDPCTSCTRCGAPFGSLVCTECEAQKDPDQIPRARRRAPFAHDSCLAAAVFQGPPSRIVRAYKDGGERRLALPIAQAMYGAARRAETEAPERYGGIVSLAQGVVFVPATAEAFCRRGFDHMELVAQNVADMAQKPLVDALVKRGEADQRALGRQARQQAARGAFQTVLDVSGQRLLLVDDVITTGATVSAAAAALKGAGAARVDVLAFARVW